MVGFGRDLCSWRIQPHLLAALDLYDAPVMDRDFHSPEPQVCECLRDIAPGRGKICVIGLLHGQLHC